SMLSYSGYSKSIYFSNDEDDVMEGIFLPVGVDLHQITILPKAEWERIQDSLTARARETARILAEKKARKDLHLKSQALVKNWTHTIVGMSQQKLKDKKIRQQREEEEKRKVDLEEAKYQAQKRKEKIEEAKLQQYYENDRVKSFHRALLYSEVLKERDAQIEFKKQHKNLYKAGMRYISDCFLSVLNHYRLMEEQRERITNRLLARMKKKVGDEDERIAREIAEKEEEQAKEEQAKEEKLQADLKSIAEHRVNVVRKNPGFLYSFDMFHYCRGLQTWQAEKIARGENEKQEDAEYVRQKEVIALCREQEFQKYAKKIIDEQSKTTQNLYPLLKRLHEGIPTCSGPANSEDQHCEKQPIQPPYVGETAQEMKLLNEQKYDHTKARLGFTW
uniref:Coiled-coil domain-containing protein 173 n=1 Tax=Naja naja TaxID=35670 RepID=A0A8C6V9G4_NAJNA